MKRLVAIAAAVLAACAIPAQASTGYGLWKAYMIPGAAHLPGDQGTFWRTDVSIVNPYAYTSITVNIAFYQELRDNSSAPSFTLAIPAHGNVLLEDVVWSRFGLTAKGALHLWASNGAYFVATARTYTGASSTYGQTINGQSYVNSGDDTAFIAGVRNAGQYRANAGVVNWSRKSASVRIDAYDGAGILRGSRTFSLPPYGSEQVSLSSFASDFASGYLRLAGLGVRDATWIAYASVVDNVSGDAVFLEERNDDVYTSRTPTHDLSGYWTGWMSMSGGSQSLDVNIYQEGAFIYAYLYDAATGFRVASLSGYQEAGQFVFSGSTSVFDYLGDTIQGVGLIQSSGWAVSGTFTGTGYYAGGGTFSLSKMYSYAACEPAQSAPQREETTDALPGRQLDPSTVPRGFGRE